MIAWPLLIVAASAGVILGVVVISILAMAEDGPR